MQIGRYKMEFKTTYGKTEEEDVQTMTMTLLEEGSNTTVRKIDGKLAEPITRTIDPKIMKHARDPNVCFVSDTTPA